MPESDNSSSSGYTSADDDPSPEQPGKRKWFHGLKRLFGINCNGTLREDLENELSKKGSSAMQEDFTTEERGLLHNILKFREIKVSDVMIPRADIRAVPLDITLNGLIAEFRASGHSRLPVYAGDLDDPKGFVHIKDVMNHLFGSALKTNGTDHYKLEDVDLSNKLPSETLMRNLLFVPASMQVTDLLVKMRTTRCHMALVIDEYGGTDGLLSLEDIIEIVFGEIEDEHDSGEEPKIAFIGNNSWQMDARVSLDDAHRELGNGFNASKWCDDVDTLGGLIFTIAGRIPAKGEIFSSDELPGYEFEITETSPKRIKSMTVKRKAAK